MRTLFLMLAAAGTLQAGDDDRDYYPLAVGMKWTYRINKLEDKFIVVASGEEKVGSTVCTRMEAKLKDKVVGIEHVGFTGAGFHRFRYDERDVMPAVCFCKPAAKKGDSWETSFRFGDVKATGKYETDFSDVTVPLGEFKNAMVVKAASIEKDPETGKDKVSRVTQWFVKGKGIVRQEIDLGEAKVVLELESLEMPKK